MDINGYLTDMNGNAVGVSSNQLVVTFTATQPQTFYLSEPTVKKDIVYKTVTLTDTVYIKELRVPKSTFEKIWQKIGYYFKWVE